MTELAKKVLQNSELKTVEILVDNGFLGFFFLVYNFNFSCISFSFSVSWLTVGFLIGHMFPDIPSL